jgi:hypothetical protein
LLGVREIVRILLSELTDLTGSGSGEKYAISELFTGALNTGNVIIPFISLWNDLDQRPVLYL